MSVILTLMSLIEADPEDLGTILKELQIFMYECTLLRVFDTNQRGT